MAALPVRLPSRSPSPDPSVVIPKLVLNTIITGGDWDRLKAALGVIRNNRKAIWAPGV